MGHSALILGLETSCDETAAAVADADGQSLSSIIFSQSIHADYGGVVPELASREHAGRLPGIVSRALEDANTSWSDCTAVAVTAGPGLVGCLLVGVAFARAAAKARDIPVIAVNHLEGHAHTPAMTDPDITYPYLVLIASGGHSSLVVVEKPGQFRGIGQTRDDAAGEALDKVGKLLGFDYPAGPELDRLGFTGDPSAVKFPRARFKDKSYDYSFSGVKTAAALDWKARQSGAKPEIARADWIASFENAVVGALSDQLFLAADELSIDTVAVAGGVACNRRLRARVSEWATKTGRHAVIPPPKLCADNAAMIASVGAYRLGEETGKATAIDAVPNWRLGDRYPKDTP